VDCPVCGCRAEDIPNTFDGKSIRCANCGEYDIAGSVYDPGEFQRLEIEQRRAALEKAKRSAQQGKRPMITTYSL
jgi:hypothetical protein